MFVRGLSVCLSESVSSVIHDVKDEMFDVYVLVVILNENKLYSLTLFDFPMGGINILLGWGVNIPFLFISNDNDWSSMEASL